MTGKADNLPRKNHFTVALSIAGSDSGGGAGIQADLKTFFALGVHATSVLTAVTAQNTQGVSAWQAVSPDLVIQQLDAVITDLDPAAIKTGMLANAGMVAELGKRLKILEIPLIVDPVLVASSGDALTGPGTVQAYLEHLLPIASLVTPNHPEARALTGMKIRNGADALQAAHNLLETGCGAVLLKGGHGRDETVEDLLLSRNGSKIYRHPRLEGVFHGTGCTLSAAITAHIALGRSLEEAVSGGIDLIGRAMKAAVQAGSGSLRILRGPSNILD